MRRRDDSLIGQIVGANVLLVTLTLFTASVLARLDLNDQQERVQFLLLALAVVLTLCVNLWMLQRRFAPLERLIQRIERIDPAEPGRLELGAESGEEIDKLSQSFRRLLDGIEDERRRSGRLVVRAQEEERRRLARDLHDEAGQALTAILLRLEALAHDTPPERIAEVLELKRLVNQAMEELTGLARQLRPSVLDDHGLATAIEAQAKGFEDTTGVSARAEILGDPSTLDEDLQIAVFRVAQEALSNVGRHAGAHSVEVELEMLDRGCELRVRDDGRGFDPDNPGRKGLGLDGMAERARLVGGELEVLSGSGRGTCVRLRLP